MRHQPHHRPLAAFGQVHVASTWISRRSRAGGRTTAARVRQRCARASGSARAQAPRSAGQFRQAQVQVARRIAAARAPAATTARPSRGPAPPAAAAATSAAATAAASSARAEPAVMRGSRAAAASTRARHLVAVVAPQVLLRALRDQPLHGAVDDRGLRELQRLGIVASARQRLGKRAQTQVEALPARQPLAPGEHDRRAHLLRQPGRQGHGVGRHPKNVSPHAHALRRHLVGQQADGFAALQRAHHLPHPTDGGWRRGQRRARACGFFQLAQHPIACRAEHHGDRPARAEALRIGLGGDLEAAHVRRQEHQAAALRQSVLDQLLAFPLHRVGNRLLGRAQPQAQALHHHLAGFGHRLAALPQRDAGAGRVHAQALAVAGRQRIDHPAQKGAQGVKESQGPPRQPAQGEKHASYNAVSAEL